LPISYGKQLLTHFSFHRIGANAAQKKAFCAVRKAELKDNVGRNLSNRGRRHATRRDRHTCFPFDLGPGNGKIDDNRMN
jgi:hypothetical protein